VQDALPADGWNTASYQTAVCQARRLAPRG